MFSRLKDRVNHPPHLAAAKTMADSQTGIFFTFFFTIVYYLITRWRQKIRNSSPIHVLTMLELAAIIAFVACCIYLLLYLGTTLVHHTHFFDEDEQEETSNCDYKSGVLSKQVVKKDLVILATEEETVTKEDEALIQAVVSGKIPSYSLESKLGEFQRAAFIRRVALERITGKSLEGLPLEGFDYESILGQCCEMPVGYIQIPVGISGPMLLDGKEFWVPMATTEGCLVASTNRGCKAIYISGGATSVLLKDGMTRAPVVRFGTAKRAAELKFFLEDPLNFHTLASVFNKSSRFGRLQTIMCAIAGKNLYIRFSCSTGDAMGMNMVSKGVQNVIDYLQACFPDMDVIGISGNYCSDKKPTAVNWIEGRGKSVVCEAIIKEQVVKNVLKTAVASLVELNMLKNLTGSAWRVLLVGSTPTQVTSCRLYTSPQVKTQLRTLKAPTVSP